jgi:hypothetical protein
MVKLTDSIQISFLLDNMVKYRKLISANGPPLGAQIISTCARMIIISSLIVQNLYLDQLSKELKGTYFEEILKSSGQAAADLEDITCKVDRIIRCRFNSSGLNCQDNLRQCLVLFQR